MSVLLAVVALGVLITVHELGHFIAAKLSGVYVETFSIGFGPKIFSFTKGDTLYCLSLIPLGGYVKLYKMFEDEQTAEISDPEKAKKLEARSFYMLPVLKKIFVITAGVVFNVIFAFILFVFINFMGIREYKPVVGVVLTGSGAETAGFLTGDVIKAVDGKKVRSWSDFIELVNISGNIEHKVAFTRDGRDINADFTASKVSYTDVFGDQNIYYDLNMYPLVRPEAGTVQPGSPAYDAGIKPGDIILSINSITVKQWMDIGSLIQTGAGANVSVEVKRGGEVLSFNVVPNKIETPGNGTRYVIGITEPKGDIVIKENPVKAVTVGIKQTLKASKAIYYSIWKMVSGQVSSKEIGGPIMIVQATSESVKMGYEGYFAFVALISINLAVLNILPLPVLDGGYLVMYIYEGFTGRRVSKKVREGAQKFGFILLMSLMVFAFYNDILRIYKG